MSDPALLSTPLPKKAQRLAFKLRFRSERQIKQVARGSAIRFSLFRHYVNVLCCAEWITVYKKNYHNIVDARGDWNPRPDHILTSTEITVAQTDALTYTQTYKHNTATDAHQHSTRARFNTHTSRLYCEWCYKLQRCKLRRSLVLLYWFPLLSVQFSA